MRQWLKEFEIQRNQARQDVHALHMDFFLVF